MAQERQNMAQEFEGVVTGSPGRTFQQVRGQAGGPGTRTVHRTAAQMAAGDDMTPEEQSQDYQQAAERAKNRIEGRDRVTAQSGGDPNAEGAEQDPEAVHREVERILNLYAAAPNRVTQAAAARLREGYAGPSA